MGGTEPSGEWCADPPAIASRVFGEFLPLASRYANLLARHGVERGLIGPREVERLWVRHLINSAAIAELIPLNAHVVDVGSGAGLPGIPLAIVRPDLHVFLVESMSRRVNWLREIANELELKVSIIHGRAEDPPIRRSIGQVDVVTARAVAPLAKLTSWCLPLLRAEGQLLAIKGDSAQEELARDEAAVRAIGGEPSVVFCGVDELEVPITVIAVKLLPTVFRAGQRTRKNR